MEMEKNQDKNTSEQLMKLIKNLQEQKNLLAERLQRLKKAELFPARINLLPFEHKSHDWEDLHYKNVGILHVLASRGRQRPYLGGDIEDKYASQSMKNLKEQNTILLEKIQKMTQKFEEFEKEKCELLEALATKDKHLTKKKNTIHHFSERINEFHMKNEQLQQIVNFYHNKNPEGIKRLSLEKLCKIESSLLSVLDNIKVHKALRIICQALPEELEDNENNALFKNYLYDMMEKDKNIKAHISFGEEIDFGTDFFDVIPMNKNTLTKTKFLNTMQKDPNIPVSVKCSIDPTTSYDSGDGEMMSPGIQNLNSFQNYFSSSVYKSDKYDMFENEEMEMLDSRLSKLRGSYKKIIDLIKRDNLDELVLQSSVSQVNMESKDASSAPQEIFSGKGVPLSSPKYRIDRLTNKENEYTNNLPSRSEDLKISNFMNPMGSVESTEAINSKMMGTTKIEDKPFQFKKLEKKKSIQKENIRVGNITLDVEKIEPKKNGLIYNDGNMSQRTAYVNLNLK